jgi:hypothetical protein
LTQIPLFKNRGASEVRPLVVARIKNLVFFNGSEVSAKERIDAEKSYLRLILKEIDQNNIVLDYNLLYMNENNDNSNSNNTSNINVVDINKNKSNNKTCEDISNLKNNSNNITLNNKNNSSNTNNNNLSTTTTTTTTTIEAILKSHPRLMELHKKHALDLLPMGKQQQTQATTISSELLTITLQNMTFISNGSLEPIQKKLPKSLTISKLNLLIKQLYGLEPRLQLLSLRLYKNSVPFLLDDESATLQYYGAIDNAEIFINEAKS